MADGGHDGATAELAMDFSLRHGLSMADGAAAGDDLDAKIAKTQDEVHVVNDLAEARS